jgi:DNA polymerase elongation subunit (family B)
VILSISHENFWTEIGPKPHGIKPYFLINDDREIPKLDNVTEISEPFELDSWVNWDKKIRVRKVFLTHPGVTPKVSTEYYKLGFETYEQAVPFLNRVSADAEANGYWPLNTNNEWMTIHCMVDDIEYMENANWLSCIGIGEFDIRIKSFIDLENEIFTMDVEIPDTCKITQLLCERNESPLDILKEFVKKLNNTHILIGHNIAEYDNYHLFKIMADFDRFKPFLRQHFYNHQGFFRGRTAENVTTFYPITWDTLHAARFLWKGESEVGYGLKQLAIKFDIAPKDRIYERNWGGWDNWNIHNPLCLKYNQDDVVETFELFKKEAKAILLQMLITGMSFQDVVQDSNGRIADCLSLVRGHNKIIQPPMMNPYKVVKALNKHFEGQLKTKKEIFDYFINHECNDNCTIDDKNYSYMRDKLMRVVKYGNEMPDFVLYYPLLLDYIPVGGFTEHPAIVMVPLHLINKADVAAMYPTIVKSKNICPDTVKLSFKGEKVDGWCWFRKIGHTEILELFEYKAASEFPYSDGEGWFIGYHNKGQEGLLNRALTGVLKAVQSYKILGKTDPDWKLAYDKSLKPMRNAFSFGVLLGLDATCQQYNIAGTAITTLGQEITNNFDAYLEENGYRLIYSDTDGSEFININAKESFEHYIRKVEQWWRPKLNDYPLQLDVEPADHKLYFAMKNYVIIHQGKITLKGHNIHGHDKPKVWENSFKRLMMEILPDTNSKEELIAEMRNRNSKVIKEEMSKASIADLVIIQSVSSPETYTNEQYSRRAEIIQQLLKRKISFGGKIEFLVCKQKLPNWEGKKTGSEPIGWMYPKQYVEEHPEIEIDRDWYADMCHNTIDTVFGFEKASSKLNVKSLFTEFQEQPEHPKLQPARSIVDVSSRPPASPMKGYFDEFEGDDGEDVFDIPESKNHKGLDNYADNFDEMKIIPKEYSEKKIKQKSL